MEITGLEALGKFNSLEAYKNSVFSKTDTENNSSSFDALLNSALEMINETNSYSNAAAQAEISYAAGEDLSTTDVLVAQMKASMSLQYTVAVRNAVMDAYKEIMQITF